MTWTEKYRPKNFSEIKGQDFAITKIKSFLESFNLKPLTKKTSKKAIVLHGPPGTGKTSLAYVTAKEMNAEIFELNASDLRNKERLHETLKPVLEQKSLGKETKIILVDEVDGISVVDRGGLPELLTLIDIASYPVIITANKIWDKKLSPLRKISELVQLKEIEYKTIKEVLNQISKQENKLINQDILTNIAIQAKGDLRAAINDLQIVSEMKDPSKFEDERNKEVDIFNALRLIFKTKPTNEILNIFDSVDMSMDEIILWVEENIPSEYSKHDLMRAYDALSKVDVFRGRIYKQQYWRFLVYENILLSYGISASKKEAKTGFTSYKKPSRILKIWMNNQRTIKKKSIAKKYAQYVHIGTARALNEFPIIKMILNSNPKIQQELKLNEEEMSYLNSNFIHN